MRERLEQILKIVCLVLAVLLLVQLAKAALHVNPLRGVSVPELPSLPADTNAVANAKTVNSVLLKPGTNAALATTPKTNTPMTAADTNTVSKPTSKREESNSAPVMASQPTPAISPSTNVPATNIVAASSQTNAAAKIVSATNAPIGDSVNTNGTNAVIAKKSKPKNSAMAGPMAMMGGFGGKKAPGLPPEIQARVDRVTDSEILAPVIHPMPMALLGIAGKVAFLRTASGQTGLVKEGDSLGEIKLLRIGINRVLIEQDGQQKELMIFSGYGGESLLPKSTENSHETTKN